MQGPETTQPAEVVHFHADNSFFDVMADRVEVSHVELAHPFEAAAPRVTVLNLTVYNSSDTITVELDQPTSARLVAAILAGFGH